METVPQDVESIFNAALERHKPEERAAYLDLVCRDDTGLRARVEALLKAHEAAGGFLDSPIIDPDATLEARHLKEGPGTNGTAVCVIRTYGDSFPLSASSSARA